MTTTETEAQTANIQVVDDSPQNLAILTAVLAEQGYEVRTAISGSLAIKSAQKRLPDLILLDVMMPDMDGYQVCQRLKADDRTRDIPVIFISALDDVVDKDKAFAVGGVDYITKPFQEEEVVARVETQLALRWAQMNLKETSTQLQELSHDLGERVKELDCLYGISKVVETPGISPEGILQGTADLIPPGWHYPEITCARISLDGQVFSTQNFQDTPWQQEAIILVHGERCGTVQVGYLEKRPDSDEGPFLKEERNLINTIANRLGRATERLRTEQLVRQQHQFLQNILDSLAHPFYVIDAQDWTVELANRAAYDGILPGRITCYALMHGHDQPCGPEHPCPLQEVRRTKEPVIVEHVHLNAEGQRRVVEVHGYPIPDQEGDVVQMLEYALDITERKRTEERIRLHEVRLAVLEERERIGRELHDDLAQVIGYVNVQAQAGLARLEQGQGAQAQAILSQLVQVAQEAHSDVRRHILGIRRPAPAGVATDRASDFFAALNGYLEALRQRYGLEVSVSLPDDMLQSPLAPDVETQLLRIIQEALTNVGLHAGVDTARLLFTLHGDEMQVVIDDDGCGFEAAREPGNSESRGFKDPETSAAEHESWVTDHGARATHHFGLAIMRERAESVGGSLEVRSTPSKGTRVIARVPLPLPEAALPGEEGKAISGLRVLLVDDHPLYLEGLRGLLSARGVQVVGMARDGLEAQSLARDLRPDLILMDVQMPRCDGLEATRRIKAELPEIKVVMLSMTASGDTLFQALRSGASGYLLKTLDRAQFFGLLAEVMRSEVVLAPELAAMVLADLRPEETDPDGQAGSLVPEAFAFPGLSSHQSQVLALVAQDFTYKEVGAKLHLSEATIKYHMGHILQVLQLKSRREAARYGRQQMELESPDREP